MCPLPLNWLFQTIPISSLREPFDDVITVVIGDLSRIIGCLQQSDSSVNDEPEQQGTAVRMSRLVLSQAEQAACSGVGGTLTAAL